MKPLLKNMNFENTKVRLCKIFRQCETIFSKEKKEQILFLTLKFLMGAYFFQTSKDSRFPKETKVYMSFLRNSTLTLFIIFRHIYNMGRKSSTEREHFVYAVCQLIMSECSTFDCSVVEIIYHQFIANFR